MLDEAVTQTMIGLARAWELSPVVSEFVEPIRRSRRGSAPGELIARFVAHLLAGYGNFAAQPLLLGSYANMAIAAEKSHGMLPETAAFASSNEGQRWLDLGRHVALSYVSTASWIRSRLPGYPNLGLPQLVAGSALTTESLSFRVPWPRSHLGAGMQFAAAPPEVRENLQHTAPAGQAVRDVARAFVESVPFKRFEAARAALDTSDRDALGRSSAEAERRLKEGSASVSGAGMAQLQFRESELSRSCHDLPQRAQDYCQAFDMIEQLLGDACSIFSQVVGFGWVPVLTDLASLDTHVEHGSPHVTAKCNDDIALMEAHLGGVVVMRYGYLDAPVLVLGTSFIVEILDHSVTIEGRVLRASVNALGDSIRGPGSLS